MNTNQLIALWYSGLIMAMVLALFAVDNRGLLLLLPLIAAILLITGLIYITLSSKIEFELRKIVKYVSFPVVFCACIVGYVVYQEYFQTLETTMEQPAVTEEVAPSLEYYEQPAVTEEVSP